jgi:pilus assembly protein Flp/PilA
MLLDLYVRTKVWLSEVPHRLRDRFTDETGAVATEYGLLLVLIAIAIILAAAALGAAISGVFDKGTGSLNNPPAG